MKKAAKLLSLLLTLTLVLSLLSGSFVFAAGGGSGFTAYSELTEDDQFLIVTEYEGKHYAFAYDGGLTAKEVTVDGDAAIPADDTVIWAAREDNALESIGTPGTFIYAGSYGLMTYTTGRTFVYDAETKHVMMHNLYYLTFDGTAFAQDKDEAMSPLQPPIDLGPARAGPGWPDPLAPSLPGPGQCPARLRVRGCRWGWSKPSPASPQGGAPELV